MLHGFLAPLTAIVWAVMFVRLSPLRFRSISGVDSLCRMSVISICLLLLVSTAAATFEGSVTIERRKFAGVSELAVDFIYSDFFCRKLDQGSHILPFIGSNWPWKLSQWYPANEL